MRTLLMLAILPLLLAELPGLESADPAPVYLAQTLQPDWRLLPLSEAERTLALTVELVKP